MLSFLAATLLIRPDIVLADFEGRTYAPWTTTGTAFGPGPARGTLPNQMRVSGYEGHGLANSFYGGDATTGTLASPEFTIERPYIRYLIGGGHDFEHTCMNLVVDGKTVRRATGRNDRPGGTEALHLESWDVQALLHKKAHIEIIDSATGGWGHINVDQIVQTDRTPPKMLTNVHRQILLDHQYLMFPMKRDAPKRRMTLSMEGGWSTTVNLSIADAKPDWWAFIDVSDFKGKHADVTFAELSDDSTGLSGIKTSDKIPNLYHEQGRGQFHFSAKSGWLNDPNGLCYYKGEYHMFFQHDPWMTESDYKTWGHAVSKDLIHWTELPEAILPDELGSMWSGSAVVDHDNTAGFGKDALVLIYACAGKPSTQCIAYSLDGRHFTKYSGNPVIQEITPYNRDPKVMWYEPTRQWIMVLYVEHEGKNYIEFHGSPDLKHWTYLSKTEGFFECPDFFELPVNGGPGKKWVLTAANTNYQVGTFDGREFHPEGPIQQGIYGGGYYAPQTFYGMPDGRRIQIGWMWTNPPGMGFTQCMSIPMEFKLVHINRGLELMRAPIPELTRIEGSAFLKATAVGSGANALANFHADASRIQIEIPEGTSVTLNLRGAIVSYDAAHHEVTAQGHKFLVTPNEGKALLDVFIDRAGLEVFANGHYAPDAFVPQPSNTHYSLEVSSGTATVSAWPLKSIWK